MLTSDRKDYEPAAVITTRLSVMKDTTGSGGLSDNATAGVRRRENLKLQVNSMPAVAAQRVNGTSHTVKPASHATQPTPAPRDGLPVKKRVCAHCATQLGRFFNTGSPCPSCGKKTCSNCRIRVYLPDRKKTWFCTFCVKERQTPRKNPNEWMQRRNSVLRRNPLPMMIANEALLTLPRDAKYSPPVPISNRLSYNGSLPRSFTALSDPPDGQLTMSDYYTATRGRPVYTPGTTGTRERKRAPPIPYKPPRTFQVITAPAAELHQAKYQSTTLGRPVKNLLSPMAVRRWEETTQVVTTLRRSKPSPQVLKEKYIHVEVISSSAVESRSTLSFNPKTAWKKDVQAHPNLLNGVSSMRHVFPSVKSATLDRAYFHRHSSFSEDSSSNPTGEHQAISSLDNGEASNTIKEPISLSATTLPRVVRKVKRNESLLSTHSTYMGSRDPDQSLSLLNLAHKSGLSQSEILTKPQPGLGHQAGLCHPSYAVFSRSDSRRRSFMDRGSLRRNSFKLDESLYKAIWNAIALEYDDFLTVVKTNLKNIAEFNLALGTHEMASRQSGKPTGTPTEVQRRLSTPIQSSSIVRDDLHVIPLAAPRVPRKSSFPSTSSPSDYITDKTSQAPWNTTEMSWQTSDPSESSSTFSQVVEQNMVPSMTPVESTQESPLTHILNPFLERVKSAGVPQTSSATEQRHISIIEIKPVSSESSDMNSKNVFEVTEIVPNVEVVLQEIPNQETLTKSKDRSPVLDHLPESPSALLDVRIQTEMVIPSREATPTEVENAEDSGMKTPLKIQRAISPPVAFFKSPEVKPRKSLAVTEEFKIKPGEEVPPAATPTHLVTSHLEKAKSEINSIVNGIPKLREVPKPTDVSTGKKSKEDGMAEFQRVLGNLREAKKPPDLARIQNAKATLTERPEAGDEVQKVSTAIQHFKKVNEEVQDLKDFLKSVRQGTKSGESPSTENASNSASHRQIEAHTDRKASPEVSAEPIPSAVTGKYAKSQNSNKSTDENVPYFKDKHDSTININGDHKVQQQKVNFQTLENAVGKDASSSPDPSSASSTSIKIIQPEPVTLQTQLTSIETRRPERAKWHSNLLSPQNNATQSDDVEADLPSFSLNSPGEILPVKKCVPATQRPVFFSQDFSDGEEEHAEADFEEESNNSTASDDGIPAIPTVKACRKVEVDDEEVDLGDAVETWEVEAQPVPYDYFGRLQIPLDSIQEESEDEERESKFTWTINRKAMRPVVSLDLSPDEGDDDGGEDLSAWHTEEEPINGQSDLEQYFITGLLQSSANKPYFRDEMDFDTLEDENVVVVKEPSIFGSAKLRFASSEYRLSSDMDDLSASSPSDDESFY